MKKIIFAFAVFMLFSTISYTQDGNLRSRIQKMNEKMSEAMVQGKPEMMSDLYAEDVISLPNYSPMIKGKQDLMTSMKEDFGSGTKITKADFNIEEVMQEGNVAIEIGTYDIEMKMAGSDENINDNGKYVTVWQKQGNDMKVLVEIWNSDKNPWKDMENMDHMNMNKNDNHMNHMDMDKDKNKNKMNEEEKE